MYSEHVQWLLWGGNYVFALVCMPVLCRSVLDPQLHGI